MTQEEKQLLLKDLCGRLPYWTIVKMADGGIEPLLNVNVDTFICNGLKGLPIPYLRPMSSMTEEEKNEYTSILGWEHLSLASVDWLNTRHFDYRGLIDKGLALPCKWLYRLEYKDDTCGLWYNGKGGWCFEEGIGSLDDSCETKTLPMDYDERYKQDGRDWFSSCSRKEDLTHWYSKEDANKLISNGFVFTRYLATEFHEYDMETVFIKETCIKREVIDFNELFKDR